MISLKKLQEKIGQMASDLGGINSFMIIMEKNGESIATFDGSIEETCENLAEGFDCFVTKLAETGMSQESCEEILQSLHECQNESVKEAGKPKIVLKLMK